MERRFVIRGAWNRNIERALKPLLISEGDELEVLLRLKSAWISLENNCAICRKFKSMPSKGKQQNIYRAFDCAVTGSYT